MERKAVLVTTYNRPEYLSKCFASLRELVLNECDIIIIVDDCSNNSETIRLVNSFYHKTAEIVRIMKLSNKGIKNSLLIGYRKAFNDLGCKFVINVDGDAIFKTNMAEKLVELKLRFPDKIITGFNTLSKDLKTNKPRHPIIETHADYYVKKTIGGINLICNRDEFEFKIKQCLQTNGHWDWKLCGLLNGIIVTRPSLVEHIGIDSSMNHSENPDISYDFYDKIHLPDVTLFGIDAHDPYGIKRAAMLCKMNFIFGGEHIITERLFSGREAYSRFCIKDMAKYIQTSHVLIIHPDGYIQNHEAWDNDLLQYDYIGATWDWHEEYQNGNGGFSLRSKRLLDILAGLDLEQYHPEDDIICRKLRPMLEQKHGIKFAPIEVCKKFSIEGYGLRPEFRKYNGEFGFHGYLVSGLPIPPPPRIEERKKKKK